MEYEQGAVYCGPWGDYEDETPVQRVKKTVKKTAKKVAKVAKNVAKAVRGK